jgi:hypothetical protein
MSLIDRYVVFIHIQTSGGSQGFQSASPEFRLSDPSISGDVASLNINIFTTKEACSKSSPRQYVSDQSTNVNFCEKFDMSIISLNLFWSL